MNNSINFSNFTDLLIFERSKEKSFHQSETTTLDNPLSLHGNRDDFFCANSDSEIPD